MGVKTYELIGEEEDGLEGEFTVAEIEEILQTGTEEIDDHGVVIAFDSEPSYERHSDSSGQRLVDFRFVLELRVFSLDGFEFDRDLFAGDDIDTEVDVTWRRSSAGESEYAQRGGKRKNESARNEDIALRNDGKGCGGGRGE